MSATNYDVAFIHLSFCDGAQYTNKTLLDTQI